jgi:hypothetical protein
MGMGRQAARFGGGSRKRWDENCSLFRLPLLYFSRSLVGIIIMCGNMISSFSLCARYVTILALVECCYDILGIYRSDCE